MTAYGQLLALATDLAAFKDVTLLTSLDTKWDHDFALYINNQRRIYVVKPISANSDDFVHLDDGICFDVFVPLDEAMAALRYAGKL